ncbi:PD-(D/E)XK motif protein [Planococcus sp. FY231025]|uniref:PD-(D/E)XK motif protein n=1 Tax=Planococcus sp. FY231025 TaxID=3455699 RepID=UPI003F931A84
MMKPIEEIRNYFSSVKPGNIVQLKSYGEDYSAWVFRDHGKFGVAIEVSARHTINERFSNSKFYTETIKLNDREPNFLWLSSGSEELRHEFASICAVFLDPGRNGEDRKRLSENPLDWWNSYKELVGNKTYIKEPYSVLGELISFFYIYMNDKSASWGGPHAASVDIQTNNELIEVKSTALRYDNVVHISSQYQLSVDRNQSLYFCRFEEANYGFSINDLVNKLIVCGYPEYKIEEALSLQGFEKNTSIRNKKYELLEMKSYKVDKDFPLIDFNSAVPPKFTDYVIKINYSIDLSGIDSVAIDKSFLKDVK